MKVLVAILLVMPLFAQTRPTPIFGLDPFFPPTLQTYFEFSAGQVTSIQRLNQAFQQFQAEKFARSFQVQSELVQESAKPTLDAMALGLRHLELEAIQREIRAQHNKTYEEIQKLLTPAQKIKLEALAAAMRLQGVICEAQSQNILGVPIPSSRISPLPLILGGGQSGFASFLLGGVLSQGIPAFYPGCAYPGNIIPAAFTPPGLVP